MIIGLIEGDPTQRRILKTQLLKHSLYSSELARLETRLLAIRTANQDSLKQFDRFFAACDMIPLNRAVFDQATLLRADSSLKTSDALHLAAAIQAECDEFWTNDKRLVRIASPHLTVMDWAALDALP
ncbi:MAG: type II toxin-antitoxin system VapC family toxin [Methylococcales bacterium]